MSTLLQTTVRAGFVGAMAVLATAGAATTAHAASDDLTYTCGSDPTFTVTARFDTAIADGATYRRGQDVFLAPVTGTIEVPSDVVDRLRNAGIDSVDGGGSVLLAIAGKEAETEDLFDATLAQTAVPATGPMTLPFRDDDPAVGLGTPLGTNVVVFKELNLSVSDTAPSDGPVLGLRCRLVEEGDVGIDTYTVVADQTATPTATADPSTTASPVRPGLVQTDAPEDEGTALLPAALLGAGAVAVVGLGGRSLRRAADRRH